MKLFGAIDLHSDNNVIVLIDEKDELVYRRRLPNDLSVILEQFSPYHSRIEGMVVESTYNWYWLVDGLIEQGYKAHLAWYVAQFGQRFRSSAAPYFGDCGRGPSERGDAGVFS